MTHVRLAKKNKSSLPVYIMTSPKGAMTADEFSKLKGDFLAEGIRLIIVRYNNNTPMAPRFDRARLAAD
jgi:hypothetical protein